MTRTCTTALVLVIAGGCSPPIINPVEAASPPCNDVGFVDPDNPPSTFLIDVPQAPGTGDCQFHEFASWNFLWLVLGSNPNMEAWPTSDMVFRPSGPPICNGAALGSHLSLSATASVPSAKTAAQPMVLGAGSTGPFSVDQAAGGPLVDQNGRYVQYEIRLNPGLCEAVQNCQLYNLQCQKAAAEAEPAFQWYVGSRPPDPVGATELKLAWRVMETCDLPDSPNPCVPDDLSQIFSVSGRGVAEYSPQYDFPRDGLTLGLIGFHLAQKTPTHPEMIWATWEHISNAPVCPDAANATCGDPSRAGVSPNSGWALVDLSVAQEKPCQGFFGTYALDGTTPCCKPDASGNPQNCLNQPYFDPDNHRSQPKTQACRQFACGVWRGSKPGSAGFPANWQQVSKDIDDLNNAIRHKLGTGSVWWNYFLVGTVWGKNATPTGVKDAAGSVLLANSTMETYFQGLQNEFGSNGSDGLNCFNCHQAGTKTNSTTGNVTNLDFIHSIVRATQDDAPCPITNFQRCVVPGATP